VFTKGTQAKANNKIGFKAKAIGSVAYTRFNSLKVQEMVSVREFEEIARAELA
jgi:hypothetical protein